MAYYRDANISGSLDFSLDVTIATETFAEDNQYWLSLAVDELKKRAILLDRSKDNKLGELKFSGCGVKWSDPVPMNYTQLSLFDETGSPSQ